MSYAPPQLRVFAIEFLAIMRKFMYQVHLLLGLLISIPMLAWAVSGFLYALPNTVEGGTVEKIDASRVKISAPEAIAKANELAGKQLPTTALTLLMKNGRPVFQRCSSVRVWLPFRRLPESI